ncbi:MFS general substrate transporter [Sarocladium strictum]
MALPHDVNVAPPAKRDLEERKAKRKLDLAIMPLLNLGFFCLQLDRGNIANAITNTFMEDVGITQFQFNVGQQLLSLGILFLFGLVSTFQAWQTNYSSYPATRFLLGVTESGYIPGGLWTLSTWYTREEIAKMVMIFFFGNQLGQASAKLIAYGILHMKGVAGIRIFSERELHILRRRVEIDDPNKSNQKTHIGVAAFKKIVCFDTYGPTIIRSFGFPSLSSNALAAVGIFLQIPVLYAFSWVSDTYDKRGETVMAGISMHMISYLLNRGFTELRPRSVRYFGVVWTQTFANLPHPLNIAWLSLTCRDPEERSLSMAMIIMSAKIAAIYGAQLFQEDDKPKYRRAFGLNSGLLGAALLLAGVRYAYGRYQHRNRK